MLYLCPDMCTLKPALRPWMYSFERQFEAENAEKKDYIRKDGMMQGDSHGGGGGMDIPN